MSDEEFREQFVALILTHGRADNVETYRALRLRGYNGRIVLVIDDEDEQVPKYQAIYGEENCYIFNKRKYIESSDEIARGDTRVHCMHAMLVLTLQGNWDINTSLNWTMTITVFRGNSTTTANTGKG